MSELNVINCTVLCKEVTTDTPVLTQFK